MYTSSPENHSSADGQLLRQRTPPAFVGRDIERALIDKLLINTVAGHGRLLLISGEAGIGKTTLVEYLTTIAQVAQVMVLSGGSNALSSKPAFRPWEEIANNFRLQMDLPDLQDALSNADAFRRLNSRELLFEHVNDFLVELADDRPIVLTLEDFQLADPDSVDLLRFVVRRLERTSMLVVVTYSDEMARTNYLYQALPFLIREGHAVRMDLQPLSVFDMRGLIQQRYRLGASDESLMIDLFEEYTRGNPFFISNLLRTLEFHNMLIEIDGDWTVAIQSSIPVPPLVRQHTEQCLAELAEDTVRILEVASVVGTEVPLNILTSVSSVAHQELVQAIESIMEAGLLEERSGSGSLYFRHGLIREVIYRSISNVRRQEIHRLIGEELLSLPVAEPEKVAFHYDQADDSRAVDWLIQAGNQARRTYNWRNAAELLETALKYLEANGATPDRQCWLMMEIGHLLRFGNPGRAVQLLAMAQKIAGRTDDCLLQANTQFSLGLSQLFVRDYEHGIPNMEAALDIPVDAPEKTGQSGAEDQFPPAYWNTERDGKPETYDQAALLGYREGLLAVAYATVGRFEDVLRIRFRYTSDNGEPSSFDDQAIDLNHMQIQLALAWTYSAYGMIAEAEQVYEAARSGFTSIGHYFMTYWLAVHELELLVYPYQTNSLDKKKRLREMANEALVRASSVLPIGVDVKKAQLPYLVADGRWQEARDLITPLELPPGPAGWRLAFHRAAGTLLHAQNESSEAWMQVHQALPYGVRTEPGTEPLFHVLSLQRLAVQLAVDEGDIDTAWSWLDAHDRWLASCDVRDRIVSGKADSVVLRALIYLTQGDYQKAQTAAEEALVRADTPVQPLIMIVANRVLGRARLAAGQPASAEVCLRRSLELAEQCQLAFEVAQTRFVLAEVHAVAGDLDSARNALAAVRRTCQAVGATRLLLQANELGNRWISDDPTSQPGPRGAGITPRELEVLELVADELTDAEIGTRLYISNRTVSQHLRIVYNKLGVNNRTEAVVSARLRGLLQP